MKTINKLVAGLLGGIVAMTSFTACEDNYDSPVIDAPVASIQPNSTILEVKKAFWDDATNYIWGTENKADATPVSIPVREDGSHYIISGRVISSDEAGNVFKSLVIQDETAALAISINSYNLYLSYRVGQEVVIDLTGMYIGKYNGLLQLGMPEWYANGNAWEASFMSSEFFQRHAQVNGWPEAAKVDTITVNSFSELSTDPDGLMKWQSQLVRFNNVKFVNGGVETFSTYHSSGVNQSITDAEGNSMIVRTSGYSNFWNQTLPAGQLDLVCIASYYGTTGWQLILIDADGCMNVGNPTVAPGTDSNPWTVNEAIAEEAAGRTPTGWVTGYIVGAVAPEVTSVTSNENIEWTSTPVLGNTIVIGQTPDTKDIANALVMELPYGSKLYSAANLVDNPSVYGKQIWVRATLDKYMDTYGLVGNNGSTGSWRIEGVEDNTGIKDGDGSKDTPYSANQVIAGMGSGTTAWAVGYIVGSSPGKSASEFVPGAAGASGTNIFIANNPEETDYTKCVPVQLPAGAVRTALNLASNPSLVGAKVALYGSLEKYFGQAGMKSVTEYELNGQGGGEPVTPPSGDNDGTEAKPFTCAEVIAFNPQSSEPVKSGVWTKGYIVGWADMSTVFYINAETARFDAPATMATNILLADNANEKDVNKCIGIQLPAGDVRSALNLQANPGNLGKQVMLKGDIAKYSGVPGIRSTSVYKLDGQGGGDTPVTPGEPVSSVNEGFDKGTLPAGWTSYKIAGDKAWYFPQFNNNYYAAMTGYKGTAPFDSWLVTPGLDLAKMADKVLTFETQVNGYGSTTTHFEVYVLTDADPSKATKTKLNPAIAEAPASGYSQWVASGNLDLSSFSGVVYVGFRYEATNDANYATWCVDNVKINADGGQGGGDEPVTPPTPSGDFKGDFNSFNGGAAKASPYGTYTNATGWTATNSIILGGTDGDDANPYFKFIGAAGTLAPTLNGKVGAAGTLTSPTLTGGIKTLTFKYGFAFSDTKAAFTVTVKDTAGNVIKQQKVDLETVTKFEVYTFTMDVNHTGDFIIEIVNDSKSQATGNKDRVSIWNLTWD